MPRIKIKYFGPIKEGYREGDNEWLDIKKVTVFIGNQGSGKSAVAKLISTFSWIEKAMAKGQIRPDELAAYNRFSKRLGYQHIDHYLSNKSEMEYQGNGYTLRFKDGAFSAEKSVENGYNLAKIMYVPAERNLLSIVDRPDKLKNLPSPLFTFLDEYDNAKNVYREGVTLPINNVRFEYDIANKIAHIIGNDYKLRLSEASSGFQSTVPLYLVTKYLAESFNRESSASINEQSIEEERKMQKEIQRIRDDEAISDEIRQEYLRQLSAKYKPVCFINIIEEPEQNLFPFSQKKMLNALLGFNNMNADNKLILTTHSPYIINYLSIAVQASETMKKIQQHYEGSIGSMRDEILKELCKENNIPLIPGDNSMHKLQEQTNDSYVRGQITERENKRNQQHKLEFEELQSKLATIIPLESVVKESDTVVYELDEEKGTIIKLASPEGIPSDDNYLNNSLAEGNILFDSLLEIEQGL